jgi:hypothetical protein
MPLRGILSTTRTLSRCTKLCQLTANDPAISDFDSLKADYTAARSSS